jgi:hypothetical protein
LASRRCIRPSASCARAHRAAYFGRPFHHFGGVTTRLRDAPVSGRSPTTALELVISVQSPSSGEV